MKNISYCVDIQESQAYNYNVKDISYYIKRRSIMGNFIEFRNVVKTYDIGEKKFNALDGISFDMPRGEFVCILGPSGAGKSTLLNLLGGMDNVSEGSIIIDNEDISTYNKKQMTDFRANNVGFIFQFYNILPTLTVLENVEIVNDIVKNANDATDILEKVGLGEHLNKFPNQLSGGEQQRVSIARAIAKNPKLLLCDEPTGALDSKTGVEVLKLLKSCCEGNNNTVIIVTHNTLISEIADRVINIKNGKIDSIVENKSPKNIDEVEW